jgi:hypothetical protein
VKFPKEAPYLWVGPSVNIRIIPKYFRWAAAGLRACRPEKTRREGPYIFKIIADTFKTAHYRVKRGKNKDEEAPQRKETGTSSLDPHPIPPPRQQVEGVRSARVS